MSEVTMSRDNYTFNERCAGYMRELHPGLNDAAISHYLRLIYSLEGWQPEDGEPVPLVENNIARYLAHYGAEQFS